MGKIYKAFLWSKNLHGNLRGKCYSLLIQRPTYSGVICLDSQERKITSNSQVCGLLSVLHLSRYAQSSFHLPHPSILFSGWSGTWRDETSYFGFMLASIGGMWGSQFDFIHLIWTSSGMSLAPLTPNKWFHNLSFYGLHMILLLSKFHELVVFD